MRLRLLLIPVVVLFCLPLFVGLGKADLENDESIYSFSVDRMLETGDWLTPKSSPNEDSPFLEKPPLKFWIVAAPIRVGLLPLDEFSLRFWDALFGSVAFLYVFAIGSLVAGPGCGLVSVLVLFTYEPLIFIHGLRSNDMEAPLLLAYCGGVYHYFRWRALGGDRCRFRHAFAVGLYFVLGFMTKFVAVLFLPLVLAAGALMLQAYRRALWRDWRLWAGVCALVLGLSAPWFAFATWKFGPLFWRVIFGQHVYTRFTAYLDPSHLEPWSFYWASLYRSFSDTGSAALAIAGLVLLAGQAIGRRSPEATILSLWFWLPVALISIGTSKLAHYVYPFVPPVAIGAGYVVALASRVAIAWLDRRLAQPNRFARLWQALAPARRPPGQVVLLAIAATAVGVAIASLIFGPIRLGVGGTTLFKSSGVLRPAIVAAICMALAGATRVAPRVIVPVLVAGLLPMPAYRHVITRLEDGRHPLRSARDCLLRIEDGRADHSTPGMYVDVPDQAMTHSAYYYFRVVRPWSRPPSADPAWFARLVTDPRQGRPMLVSDARYHDMMRRIGAGPGRAAVSPALAPFDDLLLVLPGPYAACSPEAAFGSPMSEAR